jgi:hypothetical protein
MSHGYWQRTGPSRHRLTRASPVMDANSAPCLAVLMASLRRFLSTPDQSWFSPVRGRLPYRAGPPEEATSVHTLVFGGQQMITPNASGRTPRAGTNLLDPVALGRGL